MCVDGGTFTMEGGEISGNTASSSSDGGDANGGGVYVEGGTFTFIMKGGIVYGSDGGAKANRAGFGSSLSSHYFGGIIGQYGDGSPIYTTDATVTGHN
ncbi:hypothetical protein FACS189445_1920 [Spirochaetia bacterium]|nr:hypothetical protein FACS189445_1920 [Spirochaetia bacterium]